MDIKITTEKTYWIGVSESQRDDLHRFTKMMQQGDLVNFGKRMSLSPVEIAAMIETCAAMRQALKLTINADYGEVVKHEQ